MHIYAEYSWNMRGFNRKKLEKRGKKVENRSEKKKTFNFYKCFLEEKNGIFMCKTHKNGGDYL